MIHCLKQFIFHGTGVFTQDQQTAVTEINHSVHVSTELHYDMISTAIYSITDS
jgi:hypothetical protein